MSLLSVPKKAIIGFYARSANQSVPDSWSACDGLTASSANHDLTPNDGGSGYIKPDLRNRVPIGADRTRTSSPTAVGNASSDAPSVNEAGGFNFITISPGNLPAHGHTTTTAAGGGHVHGITISNAGNHNHSASLYSYGLGVTDLMRTGTLHWADCTISATPSSDSTWNSHAHTGGSVTNDTSAHAAAHSISLSTARSPGGIAAGGQGYDGRPRSHSAVWLIKVF